MLGRRAGDRAGWRFVFFVLFVAVTALVALVRAYDDLPLSPEALRDAIQRWGTLGPLIFTAAFVLRPFIFFPSTLLFLAGGLAFGVGWGTTYAAIGGTVGAVIGFAIARVMGYEFVRGRLASRLPDIQQARWGAGLVFVLNLIPFVPMTAINYGAGLSGMELLPFTLAVAAGLTPRAFAYCFFGHSLLDIGSGEFVAAVALLAALMIGPLYVRRYWNKPPRGQSSQM